MQIIKIQCYPNTLAALFLFKLKHGKFTLIHKGKMLSPFGQPDETDVLKIRIFDFIRYM